MILVGLFIVLRRIERWLHQHIFKVGWLTTQDFQTTTILYYTFFLPGVLLHEVIYWLAAGAVNVRAEHSLQWPEEQKVGELKLNFVQLHPQASRYRKALIGLVPLIAGLSIIWLISQNIFQITDVMQTMSSGELKDVVAGIQQFTGAPDFWLWLYLVFAIGNTMFPADTRYGKEWRLFGMVIGGVSAVLLVVGFGSEIFEAIFPTLQNLVSVLQLACLLLMGADVVMVLILGTIEYVLERVTDRSATFRNGKMYTMSREEAIAERQRQKELAERRQRRRERERERQAETGPRTVYELQWSVPGKPGDVPVTEPEIPVQTEASDDTAAPSTPDDIGDRVRIPQQAALIADTPEDTDDSPDTPEKTPEGDSTPDDTPAVEPAATQTQQPISSVPPEDMPIPAKAAPDEPAPEPETPDETDNQPAPPPEDMPLPDTPAADAPAEEADASDEDEEPEDTAIADDSETSDDEDTSEAPAARRFGISPFSRPERTPDKPPETESDSTDAAPPVKRTGADAPDEPSDDTPEEKEDTPARPAARRFSISPFNAPKPDSDSDDDSDSPPAKTTAPRNPFRTRSVTPFSRMNRPSVDDSDTDSDDSDEDESIMRRTRTSSGDETSDPVRGLFTGLSSRFSDESDDDEPDTDELADDPPPLNLSGLRPLTPPRIRDEDIEYEDVDDYYDPDDL